MPFPPLLCWALFYVLIVDDRLEGPSNDRAIVLGIEGGTESGVSSELFFWKAVSLPCVSDDLGVKTAQAFECLLLVVTVITSSHIQELNGLVFIQRSRPVGPSSGSGSTGIHDDLVEGCL